MHWSWRRLQFATSADVLIFQKTRIFALARALIIIICYTAVNVTRTRSCGCIIRISFLFNEYYPLFFPFYFSRNYLKRSDKSVFEVFEAHSSWQINQNMSMFFLVKFSLQLPIIMVSAYPQAQRIRFKVFFYNINSLTIFLRVFALPRVGGTASHHPYNLYVYHMTDTQKKKKVLSVLIVSN